MKTIKRLTNKCSVLLSMLFCAAIVFSSCGSDDEDALGGVDPDKNVADPVGTITLSMRDTKNGNTYLDNIQIENENFTGWECYFASIGAVKGLGNVANIPTTGWASQVAVIPGNGYVAYNGVNFYRLYVTDYITATSGGIIGADVKYQKPFKGKDEAISLDVETVTIPAEGGTQTVLFKNQGLIVFDVTSKRFQVEKASTNDYSFLADGIAITAQPNNATSAIEDSITLTTAYGKKTVLKVRQDAVVPQGDGSYKNPFNAAAANAYVAKLPADVSTDQGFYIKGKIASIQEAYNTQYGVGSFMISDDSLSTNTFKVFRALYLEDKKYEDGQMQIKKGDEVVVYGKLVNHKGNTPETVQGEAYLYSLNGKTNDPILESFLPIYEGTFIFASADLGGESGHLFEDEIPGYICQSDKDPSRYLLVPFIYNEDGMLFTMDEAGTIVVDAQYTGADHNTYGPVYATDVVTIGLSSKYPNAKSHYDENLHTFYFDLLYHVSAGYFGAWEDTFMVTGEATNRKQFKPGKAAAPIAKKFINFNTGFPLMKK